MSIQISAYKLEKLSLHAHIQPGFAFESERFTNDASGVALVKGENVQQGFIDWAASKYWPAEDSDRYKTFYLKAGDVVLAMDRPWVTAGLKWAYIKEHDPKALLVQRVARLKSKPSLNQTYLRCLISSNYFSNYIQPIVTGVNVPHISSKQIGDFKIPVPDFPVQEKIAAVISAYDDLIENNKRRIALLEKMAEETYREWFVRMRFPGHELVKIEKGVPEGWDKVKIDDAFSFTGGGTPSKEVERYWTDGEINWFTPSDITSSEGIFLEQSEDRCTEEGLNNSSAKLFSPYSIMMTSRATIGAIGINTTPACTNQGFITCIPNERYPTFFLYHWLKLSKPYFESLAGGATFPELTKTTFKKIDIITPTADLVSRYEEIITPFFGTIESLLKANKRAKKAKDLLLPRLISGKLPVEDLNIKFPPSMSAEPAADDLEKDAAHAQLHLGRRHRAGDT